MQCLACDKCEERIEDHEGYAHVTIAHRRDGRTFYSEEEWCFKCAVESRGIKIVWEGLPLKKVRHPMVIEWVKCQPPAGWEPEPDLSPLPGQLELFPVND